MAKKNTVIAAGVGIVSYAEPISNEGVICSTIC